MTAEEILKNETTYLGKGNIAGIECHIGYIKKFKWSWMATQLNTFVIIGETDKTIDKATLEVFSKNCFEHATRHNQGWPRGFQSGIASIAILQGNNVDNSALEFSSKFSKKHWSAFELPVVFSLEQKRAVRNHSRPLWGAIYFPYLNKVIDSITSKLG